MSKRLLIGSSIDSVVRATIWVMVGMALVAGCDTPSSSDAHNDLTNMKTVRITIGASEIEAWVADTDGTRSTGLMNVTTAELAPKDDGTHRGMLFVFESEQYLSFWMKNTIIPLDIAYIQQDGRIVKTYTMAPLETRTYSSVEPALYALEVSAGLWDELGVKAGDRIEIPDSVLKPTP